MVVLLSVVSLIASLMTLAVAAETMKGIFRDIDKQRGIINFCPEGTTDKRSFDLGASVDLKNIGADMKVQINVEAKDGKTTVKDIKILERNHKVVDGC